MIQLEHVLLTRKDLPERLSGFGIKELLRIGEIVLLELILDLLGVINGGIEVLDLVRLSRLAGNLTCSRLQDLPDIHTGWDACGAHQDMDRLPALILGHHIVRQDLGDDSLVAVTPR